MSAERSAAPPDIDVILPCYNYGRYLEQAVACALDQPGVAVRVLIVDDASDDSTAEVGAGLAASHASVSYHRNRRNLGAVPTFNVGIDWVTAPGFALVSTDDLLAAGSLTRASSVLQAHPDVGLVHGDVRVFTAESEIDESQLKPDTEVPWTTRVFSGSDWIERRCRAGENNIHSPEVVVRTSTQRAVGPYVESLRHTHDMLNWLCVAATSDVARVRGPVHALYRSHPASLSNSQVAGRRVVELRHRADAYRMFFDRGLLPEKDAAVLRETAERALADVALTTASRTMDVTGELGEAVELAEFARSLGASRRAALWGCRLRMAFGPGRVTWFPPFLAGRLFRRVRGRIAYRRWLRDPD